MQGKLLMDNLIVLQKKFQAALIGNDSDFINSIVATKSPSKKMRINIYADGYFARLLEVLSDNYSELCQYMGKTAFNKMAKRYLDNYPSNFRSIRWFGDKLPIFLESYMPYQKRPILAELAKFEWAIGKTFDALDSNILTIEELKNIPASSWGEMKFTFHPSVEHHHFDYNVANIWDGLLDKQIKRAVKKHQAVLFWRNQLETFYRPLPKVDSFAICFAMNGQSFAEICDGICKFVAAESAPNIAATIIIQWINAGLISKISYR